MGPIPASTVAKPRGRIGRWLDLYYNLIYRWLATSLDTLTAPKISLGKLRRQGTQGRLSRGLIRGSFVESNYVG